jgi:hypothetical protein
VLDTDTKAVAQEIGAAGRRPDAWRVDHVPQ